MARPNRKQQFTPDEPAIVHVMNRAVRRCFLMGVDQCTGNNYDYRKDWIERRIEYQAKYFGIDVLSYSILSNHLHMVLRQRPDIVKSWNDTEVARRWLMLCPKKKNKDGSPKEPTEPQLNLIRHNTEMVKEIRSRLSNISWWMRLMCQTIAQRINLEEETTGKVWESRFKAVRLLDETALLACSAYVDLNPIRAALAQTLEMSDFTSIQRRIEAVKQQFEADSLNSSLASELDHGDQTMVGPSNGEQAEKISQAVQQRKQAMTQARDRSLAPIQLSQTQDSTQTMPSETGYRCSDRGFLNMKSSEYIELLDWTARRIVPNKPGSTPSEAPPVFERLKLGISEAGWCELVAEFRRIFSVFAGKPQVVDDYRNVHSPNRHKLSHRARELLEV